MRDRIKDRTNAELFESILSGKKEYRPIRAQRIIKTLFQSYRSLDLRELEELGLHPKEAERLASMQELLHRTSHPKAPTTPLNTPDAAFLALNNYFAGMEREGFAVLVLDVKNRPKLLHEVALGSVDSCLVDPREVFLPAFRERGSAIIVGHNHPSGDPEPSREDLELTWRLTEIGALMNIPLLDHLILATGAHAVGLKYISLAGRGEIIAPRKTPKHFQLAQTG
ncbi:hypothetical protein KAI87_07970 [Myxococcota bacterium]|nr:hypothetical protein [Myxococcota bacterium]